MPLELGIWRIDHDLEPIEFSSLDMESRLEDVLDRNITIASPNWMVIGRQVHTDYGPIVDLLALDRDANLVVIELKRDKTYRDTVAQVLDYGAWVRELKDARIALIFDEYQKRWHSRQPIVSINDAFCARFGVTMPEEMNSTHELVIVATKLDPSSERIVRYLVDEYGVRINAAFFRVFRDGEREYLARAWFRDPAEIAIGPIDDSSASEWNGEYYASFGYPLEVVRDGLERGYLAAGGGTWYSRTLAQLAPGDRVWVNVPGSGYVGVGIVEEAMQPVEQFAARDESGNAVPLSHVSEIAKNLRQATDDPEEADYLVRLEWLKHVDPAQAIREKGFFGNQNSVARPVTPKWDYTVSRLKQRFGIE